jgi:hypothetical protein
MNKFHTGYVIDFSKKNSYIDSFKISLKAFNSLYKKAKKIISNFTTRVLSDN